MDTDELERYQSIRKMQQELTAKLMSNIVNVKEEMRDAAHELGIPFRNGTICFDDPNDMDRLQDFIYFEKHRDGSTSSGKILESGFPFSTEETTFLRAATAAETSLFEIVDLRRSEHSLLLRDLLREDAPEKWIIDIAFSKSPCMGVMLFCRLLEMDDFAFTSGASLAFAPEEKAFLLSQYRKIARIPNPTLRARKRFGFFVKQARNSLIKTIYE